MRRFVAFGPAFVVLMSACVVLVAAPAVISRVSAAHTRATVTLAQQSLDSDDILIRLNAAIRNVDQAVRPSVVHLDVRSNDRNRSRYRGSAGSGWVFDDQGHIVTNAHVVAGADVLRVQFYDGRVASATVLGMDPLTDVAVVKVSLGPHLIPIRRATSELIAVGDRAFAFGSPFGFKFSMSEGVVSGLGRSARTTMGFAGLSNFIQTDAAVNPGNSGGPLVDVRGRLIGMNVAIATATETEGGTEGQSAGISFAIPLRTVEARVQQIIAGQPIIPGFLGVSFAAGEQIRPSDADGVPGVRVTQVTEGGPADAAGLRAGDIITHIEGEELVSAETLRSLISTSEPGSTVALRVWRDGEVIELRATLGQMPAIAQGQMHREMLRNDFGLVLQDRNGAIVRAIIPGSPAADQGLRDGMRITHVNNVAVDDANAAAAALYINGLLWGRTVRVNVEQTVAGQEGAPDSTQALELVLRIGN
jgi:S1-C subfamily serine protease